MTEDQALIERSRAGSIAAFDELMRRHEWFIFKIAFAYVRNAETAMDIVQNVFVKTFNRLAHIRGDGNFKAWIAKVACRESIDALRLSRRSRGQVPLEDLPLASPEAGQEEGLIRAQQSARIRSAIEKLNPRQQLAVSLRYFEGASLREISDRLDCDVSLTKNILFRSLEKLRRHLDPLKECF
ncbi:MAG: sigma-70 family RNA polymerase sigma factor [Candidatus Aminicenantes bacterium]|nr:sigma-70 family RNA polymerase sigma factor [Candidatus Aminicenantes bacterium]